MGRYLVEALFPRWCISCGREGVLWCQRCLDDYQPINLSAGCPFCGSGTIGARVCDACRPNVFLDGLHVVGSYADPRMRKTIHAWKYHTDQTVVPIVAKWIRSRIPSFGFLGEQIVVSWVPLHAGKKRSRGFDQAQIVSQMLAQETGYRSQSLLKRVRSTASQAQRQDRTLGELDNVFSVMGAVPKAVILCDDVFTSGTTMDAAARALKEAGATVVWGFTLAS